MVALPALASQRLPAGVETITAAAANSESGRLVWEQRRLPALAQATGAGFIHTPYRRAALFGGVRVIASPTEADRRLEPNPAGLSGRLAEALAQGGMTRYRTFVWPDDLPGPPDQPVKRLPPIAHPAFQPDVRSTGSVDVEPNPPDLPDTFILYHGPVGELALRVLLEAWSWAVGSIGEYYPLLLAGLNTAAQDRLRRLLAEYRLTGTARPLPSLDIAELAAVYRDATVVLHPHEPEAWGGSARLAMSAGKPVVGVEGERMGALVGPAAYLARAGDSAAEECRALGAALISVVVDDSLAEQLARAARERSGSWTLAAFRAGLERLYASLFDR